VGPSHLDSFPLPGYSSAMATRIQARTTLKVVRPDNKHRIALGHLADGVSSYRLEQKDDGVLILSPLVEIPAGEAWLWKNKTALASVQRGLAQAAKGPGKYLGSFAKHATDEE
jgi:hypothetical protein